MSGWILWLRWSWRDLRRHWKQVMTIALIIALGTGTYSGLVSTTPWRLASADDSYGMLNMHDLRLSLTSGSFLDRDALMSAVDGIEHREWIRDIEPRLIVPTLVDASTAGRTIMIPGRLIGVDLAATGDRVDDLHVARGRGLKAADAGEAVGILEAKFADYYGLPSEGDIRLSGDERLHYVGTGMQPEYFIIYTDGGGMMAEANFAVVFTSLETAQSVAGHIGRVNDLVITVTPDADLSALGAELTDAVHQLAPIGVSVLTQEDDPGRKMVYEDAIKDEEFWRIMAFVFLAGAVFGAFNLATRLVESQRREIGIQMALGVPSRRMAIRPLLVALQIATLGVVFGLLIGLVLGGAFGGLMQAMMPMPVFEMPFQARTYAVAAAIGIALPMLATLLPVMRALRVEPVDAIRTGHLVAKGGGFAPLLARRTWTRHVLAQMPIRAVLRAPRRTLLTVMGIAAAVAMLVLIMGMLDTFYLTLGQAREELLQQNPQRMLVQLNFFYPEDSAVVTAVDALPEVEQADPVLKVGGYLIHDGETIETLLDLVNANNAVWQPTIVGGVLSSERPSIVISEVAARDLGVQPGDKITLRHPARTGLLAYDWVETEVEVGGLHPLPLRGYTYMDFQQAGLMGIAGLVNAVQVTPSAGATQDEVKQALFDLRGVASVQPVSAVISVFDELIGEFVSILGLMELSAVLLAVLIAYNSTAISLDERVRDIATMFAFGVRVRTVLLVTIFENLIMSGLGAMLGLALGVVAVVWMVGSVMQEFLPDIGLSLNLSASSVGMVVAIAVAVALLTPVLSIRRLQKMDIPATLRVME